jgi:transcriptional regulator with XRE-family HTH domain
MISTLQLQRFGEKLRLLRTRNGMTMQALAEKLDTVSSYISMLEHGQREPKASFVLKVSRLFDVPVDVLLKDEEEL